MFVISEDHCTSVAISRSCTIEFAALSANWIRAAKFSDCHIDNHFTNRLFPKSGLYPFRVFTPRWRPHSDCRMRFKYQGLFDALCVAPKIRIEQNVYIGSRISISRTL